MLDKVPPKGLQPMEGPTLEQGAGVRRKEIAESGCNKLTTVPILLHHSGMGGRGVTREGVKLNLGISAGVGKTLFLLLKKKISGSHLF